MWEQSIGEIASLIAVFGWTGSALAFEAAGRRIGSVPVNVIRLAMAAAILAFLNALRGFGLWPAFLPPMDFLWLAASGFVGFFLGDLFLFRSYLIIGSRLAMLVMSLSPPLSALLDYWAFGVRLSHADVLGMFLTVSGVALAAIGSPASVKKHASPSPEGRRSRIPARGIGFLLAFCGAAGQSGGMILAKFGMSTHDPLVGTFVRSLGGMAGFLILILFTGAAGRVMHGLKNGRAMAVMGIGAMAGPVMGVSAILTALRHSPAGVVSAITSLTPVVIILPAVLFFHEKVRAIEVIGAVVAASGLFVLVAT